MHYKDIANIGNWIIFKNSNLSFSLLNSYKFQRYLYTKHQVLRRKLFCYHVTKTIRENNAFLIFVEVFSSYFLIFTAKNKRKLFHYDFFISILLGGIFFFLYVIQYFFICHPSDSTVSEDDGIEPRTVATLVWTVRRSNHSAKSHPHSVRSHPDSARSHPHSARSHPYSARYHHLNSYRRRPC